jgi:hypothetical protein
MHPGLGRFWPGRQTRRGIFKRMTATQTGTYYSVRRLKRRAGLKEGRHLSSLSCSTWGGWLAGWRRVLAAFEEEADGRCPGLPHTVIRWALYTYPRPAPDPPFWCPYPTVEVDDKSSVDPTTERDTKQRRASWAI